MSEELQACDICEQTSDLTEYYAGSGRVLRVCRECQQRLREHSRTTEEERSQ